MVFRMPSERAAHMIISVGVVEGLRLFFTSCPGNHTSAQSNLKPHLSKALITWTDTGHSLTLMNYQCEVQSITQWQC